MIHFALTRLEKSTLEKLKELHAKHPANDWGFWASSLGASKAAAARRMEHTGLIKIDRQAGNCFRYALTDTGKERVGQ